MDISRPQGAGATSSKASSPHVVVDETSTTDDSQKKRQRIERACDSCRHRKIRCDGKKPSCGHCVAYGHDECTYNRPSNRQRNALAKKVKELSSNVDALAGLIRKMIPGFNVENYLSKKDPKFIHHEPKPMETPITIENAFPVSKESGFSGVITPVPVENAFPVLKELEFSEVITPVTIENALPVSTESECSGFVITPATVENAIPVLPESNLSGMMIPLDDPWLIPNIPNANIHNNNDMTRNNQTACGLPQQSQQQYEQNLGAMTCENQGTGYYTMTCESLNGNNYVTNYGKVDTGCYPTTYNQGGAGYYPVNYNYPMTCKNQDPGYCYQNYYRQ